LEIETASKSDNKGIVSKTLFGQQAIKKIPEGSNDLKFM